MFDNKALMVGLLRDCIKSEAGRIVDNGIATASEVNALVTSQLDGDGELIVTLTSAHKALTRIVLNEDFPKVEKVAKVTNDRELPTINRDASDRVLRDLLPKLESMAYNLGKSGHYEEAYKIEREMQKLSGQFQMPKELHGDIQAMQAWAAKRAMDTGVQVDWAKSYLSEYGLPPNLKDRLVLIADTTKPDAGKHAALDDILSAITNKKIRREQDLTISDIERDNAEGEAQAEAEKQGYDAFIEDSMQKVADVIRDYEAAEAYRDVDEDDRARERADKVEEGFLGTQKDIVMGELGLTPSGSNESDEMEIRQHAQARFPQYTGGGMPYVDVLNMILSSTS